MHPVEGRGYLMSINSLSRINPVSHHEAETQKLIRCEIAHPNGTASIRFIALDVFLLWAHMMRTRHNMECKEYSISLWLPADEFENKSGIFTHSGNIEPVNRINFSLFDDTYHYTYRASRFVLDNDSGRFKEAMYSHMPLQLRTSNRLDVEETPGYCIGRETVSNGDHLVLGLFSGLSDIY